MLVFRGGALTNLRYWQIITWLMSTVGSTLNPPFTIQRSVGDASCTWKSLATMFLKGGLSWYSGWLSGYMSDDTHPSLTWLSTLLAVPNLKPAIDFITTVQKETAKKTTHQKGEFHCMFCKAKWVLNWDKFKLKLDFSKRSYQPTTTILTMILNLKFTLFLRSRDIFQVPNSSPIWSIPTWMSMSNLPGPSIQDLSWLIIFHWLHGVAFHLARIDYFELNQQSSGEGEWYIWVCHNHLKQA